MIQSNSHGARYSVALRTSTDAWTHSRSVSGGWCHEYEQLERGPFYGEIREAWLGPIQVVYERVSGPVKYVGRPWRGARFFTSYCTGKGGLYWDNRVVDDNVVTTGRWDEIDRLTCSQPSEWLLVAVDEDYFDRLAAVATGRECFRKNKAPPTYIADPALVQRFQNSVVDVLRAAQLDPELLDAPHTRESLRNRIVDTLLSVMVDRTDDDVPLPPPCTRAYIVDKAIEFIDSRLCEAVTITDICTFVRVCSRTLCYSFEAVLGVSPSRYLLATRLNRVRRDILTLGDGVSLQALAARWGLCHMGRFARYYRETFGERPSDTVRSAAARWIIPQGHIPHSRARDPSPHPAISIHASFLVVRTEGSHPPGDSSRPPGLTRSSRLGVNALIDGGTILGSLSTFSCRPI